VKLARENNFDEIYENILKIKSAKKKPKPKYLDKTIDKYQIIYKSDGTVGHGRSKQIVSQTTNSLSGTSDVNIVKVKDTVFTVRPRGYKTGFLNRHQFQKFFKDSSNSEKNKDVIPSKKLQFGFTPLTKSSKQSNEIYFDPNIDTLQAPSEKKNHNKNEKRSQKYFTSVSRFVNNPVRKQDKKSHLNLLGIFDTRKYFFIPQNRRSEKNGIFSSLVNLFRS
jgi:hypothetical protein